MLNLISNMGDVDRLIQIHSEITPGGRGRKYAVEVLHKSAIVLLAASWEAYVEDLAKAALNYLVTHAKVYDVFPESVLERVASRNSGILAWKLAGDGWRQTLVDNLREVLARTTGTLNTPKTPQVDELFQKTIGLPKLSSAWYWRGRSAGEASTALDDLITLRGEIAHRATAARHVQKNDVICAREMVYRLSVRSHNCVCQFLAERLGACAWAPVKYKKTS